MPSALWPPRLERNDPRALKRSVRCPARQRNPLSPRWTGMPRTAMTSSRQTWSTFGCGSKLGGQGSAGVRLWFHLPRCHFGTFFLSHTHLSLFVLRDSSVLARPAQRPLIKSDSESRLFRLASTSGLAAKGFGIQGYGMVFMVWFPSQRHKQCPA